MPEELAALIPNYLKALPRDLVDGQPLRYRLNADGSYLLYSIGANGKDEAGDARPENADSGPLYATFGSGRDWVWFQTAATDNYARTSGAK